MRIILIHSLLFFALHDELLAQTFRLSINEAVFLINKNKKTVHDSLASLNYSYKGRQGEFEQYDKEKLFGYSQLNVNFKNQKLNTIGWSESVLYAPTIMSELLDQEFVLDENSLSTVQVYRNKSKLLMLTLIVHSGDGYIFVTIGRDQNNKEQTTANGQSNTQKLIFFTGTRKFCEELNIWYYLVTIKKDSIILKAYPGKENTARKDKSKPIEIIKGIIKNGKIITKDPPEYLTNRFKFEDGILYEVNNEGEYNDYHECKIED